ncbi:hypothetical protein J2X31_000693 [Flavobacterium arsenatis]|uniref:DUF4270 domain-containing protein n=1 Tax=Flavobacterium arsenatis TaxID=1484332 RepID=A0ABU1TL88_9FLAO|nr:DUF4270 domain-containing protein [Flavobacterium arsenatis]MDR6966695.1 hypothetical protein [Flavobacterium arsenatis]
MNKSSIFRLILVAAAAMFLLTSCDKDFNQIGSDVIGDDHFDLLPDDLATVVAHNRGTGIVQTNNMLINSLGIYDNPVFGKTKANFVTELQMASVNPTFKPELFVSLDSVVLSVPYFSTKTATGSDGKGTYRLDSIFSADPENLKPINLRIYESGYVLNDLAPPNFQNSQKYFSNEDSFFDSNKRVLLYSNDAFKPSDKEIITYKRDKGLVLDTTSIEARLTPRMRFHLNKSFFQDKIINAPQGKLVSQSIFKEYFRGVYFQVQDSQDGTLVQYKFGDGDITLYYTEYSGLEDADDNPNTPETPIKFPEDDPLYPNIPRKTDRSFVLKMAGNTVNLLENTPTPQYAAALQPTNSISGDDKLFIKGGEGSMAVLDLFGVDNFGSNGLTGIPNGVPDELDIIRENVRIKGWLINEASLTFHIDNSTEGMNLPIGDVKKVKEPQRLYLYDLNNKRPLIDYYNDGSTISSRPKFNKFVHDGLIRREEVAGGRGVKYKIRITNHIRNLVKVQDSTNVKLGLVVTEYIENIQNAWFKTPSTIGGVSVDRTPQASVMNPLGTVLHGTGDNVLPEKRVRLEIYYTKPN